MTVRDIFIAALTLKRERKLDPRQIADRLSAIGRDNGFSAGVREDPLEVTFTGRPGGGVISFDGVDWHYRMNDT